MMPVENKRSYTRSYPASFTTTFPRRVAVLIATIALFCGLHGAAQVPVAAGVRNLSGKVTDGHEPIRGAVVELQNPATNSIVSYVTEADGLYHFKRLDGETDFNVWVMFHGHRSAVRSISKFDNHMDKVINFTVKTY